MNCVDITDNGAAVFVLAASGRRREEGGAVAGIGVGTTSNT